jgi:hypothetical protein
MRKLGAFVVGGILVGACVSNTPPATGALDGPCFSDNTCDPGLVCNLVMAVGTCLAGDAGADASAADTGVTDVADSGPPVCSFTPTTYPCGGQMPPWACFGSTQTCTATGCSDFNDLEWQCFSPNQCSGTACCLTAANGTLSGAASCTQGTLLVTAEDAGGSGSGTQCSAGLACAAGDTQLCQGNAQCPTGEICNPVKVAGGAASLYGATLGACAPQ